MAKEIILKISGQVQGVFFRTETKKVADQLGLTGYVKNEPDGSVTIVAQGDEEALKKLEQWSWHGSPQAKIKNVETKYRPIKSIFEDFQIKY